MTGYGYCCKNLSLKAFGKGVEVVRKSLSTVIIGLGVMVCLAGSGLGQGSDSEAPVVSAVQKEFACPPTPPDGMGPFYKPNAPLRNSVGEGYVLKGVVRSAVDCSPIADAQIEFWLAGPDGRYDDEHRARIVTDTGRVPVREQFSSQVQFPVTSYSHTRIGRRISTPRYPALSGERINRGVHGSGAGSNTVIRRSALREEYEYMFDLVESLRDDFLHCRIASKRIK